MTLEKRIPLVLVVDDVDEFREEVIAPTLEELGTRVLKAANPNEALKTIAEKQDIRNNDPIDLVVLDMHMPMSSNSSTMREDAGVQMLYFVKRFRLCVGCPIIIFTAYPSYRNCVAAARAGASAYIPKLTQESEEGGLEDLVNTCRRLLFEPKGTVAEPPPTNNWVNQNADWLHQNCHGKWVAFLSEAAASSAGLVDKERYPVRDGIVLVPGGSYEEVRSVILQDLRLYQEFPVIAMIAPSDQDIARKMED